MVFDARLASIRFGVGVSPLHPLPSDREALLSDLTGPDAMALAHPIPHFAQASPNLKDWADAFRARRLAKDTSRFDDADARVRAMRQQARAAETKDMMRTIARGLDAPIGFRERLVAFWADHFTVKARNGQHRHLVSAYIEDAIRPHLAGRFADMLHAVETQPMMLIYLQQARASTRKAAARAGVQTSVNENLARELLELHTLGVDGGYTQTDVTAAARLLAGLVVTPQDGTVFEPARTPRGAQHVLGRTYHPRGEAPVISALMSDLARHPATARHLARKLVCHFVADQPDPDLVASVAAAYQTSDGNLLACYEALLAHPAAWKDPAQKVRPPVDYMVAALRALGVTGAQVTTLRTVEMRDLFLRPLQGMGQPWQRPTGPDGWPERGADWIIPQTMAARIMWAMDVPRLVTDGVPAPRDVLRTVFGDAPDPAIAFAAQAAETRAEGTGLILASAAFQRR